MQAIAASTDPEEREFIAHVLGRSGFTVQLKADLGSAASEWLENPAELVVLAGRTRHDLETTIKALRSSSQVPLIVLIEASNESEVCTLLQDGADLVLRTPVGSKLLAGYCHALLRRSGDAPAFALPTLDLGLIALDPSTRSVTLEGRAVVRLTQLEFRLLHMLMTHRGQVIHWEVIVERVWGYYGGGSRELVRGLVSRLRAKIEPDTSSPGFVHTVPGVGYIFDIELP